MKHFLVLLAMVVSTNAIAAEPVVLSYRFGQATPTYDRKAVFYRADVSDSGVLVINQLSMMKPNDPTQDKLVLKYQLSVPTNEYYKNQVRMLQDAKIKIEDRRIVCRMLPPPGAHIDHLSVIRAEGLKEVDGPHGCWVGKLIAPVEHEMEEIVHKVKDSLRILTLELVSSHR